MEKRKYCSHLQKKSDKQNVKNYRPVSVLPICGKILEIKKKRRLIFNEMFNYLSAMKLISKNQSGFQPRDSCINQLLSINQEIFTSFDNGLEVRSVFLDLSKTFDIVWHKGVIFKLKQKGILLSNRKQRIALWAKFVMDQCSCWSSTTIYSRSILFNLYK